MNLDFTSAKARFAGPSTQTLIKSTAGRDIEVALRAGYRVGDATLVYVKAGYDNARFKTVTTVEMFGGNSEGLRLGAGVEQRLTGQSYVKLEYRYTNYGRALAFDDFGTRQQVVAGLGMRF